MENDTKRFNLPAVDRTLLNRFRVVALKKDMAITDAVRELMCRVVLGETTLTSELFWYCICDEMNVHRAKDFECEHCKQQRGD